MTDFKATGLPKSDTSGNHGTQLRDRLERLQVCVSKDIMDRCWNIASIDRVTVASLVEEALAREMDRRESQRGKPYPRRRNGRSVRRTPPRKIPG